MMARSPIGIMIDQTTEYGPGDPSPDLIQLRCPLCGRTKTAPIDATDPPGTAVVEAPCDECDRGELKPEVRYYDAKGAWFDGEKFRY